MGTSHQILHLASSQSHIPFHKPHSQSHADHVLPHPSSPTHFLGAEHYHAQNHSASITPLSLHRAATPPPQPLTAALPVKLHSGTSPPSAIHIVDISYPESYLRTPIPQAPYAQPKWLEKTSVLCKNVVGGVDVIIEECDVDVVQSVEVEHDARGEERGDVEVWGDGRREWGGYVVSEERKSFGQGEEKERGRTLKRGYEECFTGRQNGDFKKRCVEV